MNFLPFLNIIYKSKLNEDEIIKRLNELIEPKKILRNGIFVDVSTKLYEGKIIENKFNINRIISYNNSFLPRIIGTFKYVNFDLVINVKMRLHFFVLIFTIIWFTIIGLTFLGLLVMSFSNFTPLVFLPFGLLLFFYVITIGFFNYESNKTKKDLKLLFEADIIK